MQQQLKEILALSGFTGRQLASILPCKYSQFTMAEGGKRNLPAPAITLCITMYRLLQEQQQQTTAAILPAGTNDQGWQLGWLRKTKHQLNLIEEQLTNLEEKIERAYRQLVAAQLLLEHLQLPEESLETMELNLIERKAAGKIRATKLKMRPLLLEATGLQAQMDLAATW
ncbi:MAG: hypothetical protein ABIX01_12715 [Chitinophagaceae bacterium]